MNDPFYFHVDVATFKILVVRALTVPLLTNASLQPYHLKTCASYSRPAFNGGESDDAGKPDSSEQRHQLSQQQNHKRRHYHLCRWPTNSALF